MYKDSSHTILLEKDFKEDIQLIKELCELMRENLKDIGGDRDELYLSINSAYSIQRWAEEVLNKSEHEKRDGHSDLGYSIKHMKKAKASGDS